MFPLLSKSNKTVAFIAALVPAFIFITCTLPLLFSTSSNIIPDESTVSVILISPQRLFSGIKKSG